MFWTRHYWIPHPQTLQERYSICQIFIIYFLNLSWFSHKPREKKTQAFDNSIWFNPWPGGLYRRDQAMFWTWRHWIPNPQALQEEHSIFQILSKSITIHSKATRKNTSAFNNLIWFDHWPGGLYRRDQTMFWTWRHWIPHPQALQKRQRTSQIQGQERLCHIRCIHRERAQSTGKSRVLTFSGGVSQRLRLFLSET